MDDKYFFLYILECSNKSYYTGYTNDIERRYKEHVAGTPKCKYTRSFPPVLLAACWQCPLDLSLVLKIEKLIKSLSRVEKIKLINKPALLIETLQVMKYCQQFTENIHIVNLKEIG